MAPRMWLLDLACLLGMLGMGASIARAQPSSIGPAASPAEAWVSVNVTPWQTAGTLESSFPLSVSGSPGSQGRARQSLVLDPATGRGVDVGINVFPAPHVGVQAFLAFTRADLAGVNGPYVLDLSYISRPPPDSAPINVDLHHSRSWPETRGRAVQWNVGLGPVVRGGSGRVAFAGSGGLVWHRVSGEVEPLGFTTFTLGGHSALFESDYLVRAALGPSWSTGAYLGGGVDFAIGRHVAATVGCLALLGGPVEVSTRVDAVVDADGGLSAPSPAQIDASMTLPPWEMSPRALSLRFGIKIR